MNTEEFEKLKEETLALARESLMFRNFPDNLREFERVVGLKNDPDNDEEIIRFCLNMFKELEELLEEGFKFWAEVHTLTELKELGLA
ncbi:MAG: hypothetical protein Q8Q95_00350 [bacterium]|nr:hypothetical protein [bacterium]